MSDHLDLQLVGSNDDQPEAAVVGRVHTFEVRVHAGTGDAAPEAGATGCRIEGPGLVIVLHAVENPTAEQLAELTTRAQGGSLLTVAQLDLLGLRVGVTQWAADGFPGL